MQKQLRFQFVRTGNRGDSVVYGTDAWQQRGKTGIRPDYYGRVI